MHASHSLVGLASLLTLSVAAPAPGREINIPAGVELGRVKVCNSLHEQGTRHTINAYMACTQLESPVRFNLHSLVQDKGNICSYSQGGNCDKPVFIVDSSANTQVADVAPKWTLMMTSVLCIPGSAGMGSASASGSLGYDSIPVPVLPYAPLKSDNPKPAIVARQNPNPQPGDALICSPDIRPGPCFKVSASSSCTALRPGVSRAVRTIYQNWGSYCEYFATGDCHERLGYSDSTKQNIRSTVPVRIGAQMGSAYCIASPLGAEGAGVEEEGWKAGEFVAEEGGN